MNYQSKDYSPGRELTKGQKMAREIIAVRDLEERLGRAPEYKEVEEETGFSISSILYHWGYRPGDPDRGAKRAADLLYAAALVTGRRGRGSVKGEIRGAQIRTTREPGTLGYRLTEKRRERDLSLRLAAELLGVNHKTMSNHETNSRNPPLGTIAKYAEFYDVTIDWLIFGDLASDFFAA